jgi:hypothetical protein
MTSYILIHEKGGQKMIEVKNKNGTVIDYEMAVNFMDDEIREELHGELAPCTEQEFFTRYEEEHELKFNEEWELSKKNPTW